MKICFIILHYMTIQDTKDCIVSIQNNIGENDYSIIVVDNGSSNGTGCCLQEEYEDSDNIHIILSESNLGFAKGNNLGYQYMKEHENADFVVILNSDTIVVNQEFVNNIPLIYEKNKCDVFGPDIVTPENLHQNPLRENVLDIKDVQNRIRNKTVFLYYYKIKKLFHIGDRINILEKMFDKRSENTRNSISFERAKDDVVLQGACLIFSKKYIESEENAFLPDTFMYGEEDLLAYYCQKCGYKMRYDPRISILHKDGSSTKNKCQNNLNKNIFFTEHALAAAKILLKKMKSQ